MFGKKRYGTKRASYQFVMWFPHFVGFGFKRTRIKDSGMAMVYDWFFGLDSSRFASGRVNLKHVRRIDENFSC